MNLPKILRSLAYLGHEFDVSSRTSRISIGTNLLGSHPGQTQLIQDIQSVVSEMVKDRVE